MSQLSFIDNHSDEMIEIKKPILICKIHKWADESHLRDYIINKRGDVKKICIFCIFRLEERKKIKLMEDKKERDELTDNYIKKILKVKKSVQVPEILLDTKRIAIKIKRTIKDKLKPLLKCKIHGNLYQDAVNKAGMNASGTQRYKCKKCMSIMQKRHYEMNKLTVRLKHKMYREENKDKVRESKRKSWLKCKGMTINQHESLIEIRKTFKEFQKLRSRNGKDKNN